MDADEPFADSFGSFTSVIERRNSSFPTVIVIGSGISGLAAARILHDASFEVVLLESRDRLGGRIHTDFSLGCPVDMGASWLHGVCNENPLAPLIRSLGLNMYRTSGDNSVLYDHDLESYVLFDMEGNMVPQQIVVEVGDVFKRILDEVSSSLIIMQRFITVRHIRKDLLVVFFLQTEKVRDENAGDMSVLQAISIVLEKQPELRQEGIAHEVLQWYICRMEAWFAADADMISLKCWDQEHVLSGGHGLMVQGYDPIIRSLAKDLDIRLNHRVTRIYNGSSKVMVTVENGRVFVADACILTVPLGILKANLIQFEPKLPEWKTTAISDIGFGSENKIAMRFSSVFWPDVEFIGIVAPSSYCCGYFLNLHKATGNHVLVYMAAGRFANDLEELSDESATKFVMQQLKKMFPDATEPVQHLVSRWGKDPDSLGCYSYDAVGMSPDLYDKLRTPLGNLFFGGEAVSVDHQGSVHGAYSAGVMAAETCRGHLLKKLGNLEKPQLLISFSPETAFPLQISRM